MWFICKMYRMRVYRLQTIKSIYLIKTEIYMKCDCWKLIQMNIFGVYERNRRYSCCRQGATLVTIGEYHNPIGKSSGKPRWQTCPTVQEKTWLLLVTSHRTLRTVTSGRLNIYWRLLPRSSCLSSGSESIV